ncbi:MAG TPA: thermonuclease family protein [Hyphomonas sp.]|nr:thermonuclease family protein [Hyphomonas sp.]MCB9962149.1 thermonuclease family protein [Hyphomonas sp.]HPE49045.1 thermonuclease family protein [Hyphomonas sp.]
MAQSIRLKEWLIAAVVLAGIAAGIALAAQATTDGPLPPPGPAYWSDGDSGRLADGTKFRLHGIDAPETGSTKQIHGAKCEAERALGYDAKAAVLDLTRGKDLTVTHDYGHDRYGRLVVDLSVDGHDLSAELIAGGTHAAWDYDGGQRKPDWCAPHLPAERLASR